MTAAWGPFARQCTSTRTSHYAMVGREPEDVATTYEACIGFAAMPAAHGAMQITGSTTSNRRSSVPIVYRILRGPSGVSRPATSGDTGLLAQGSDSPSSAEAFAREIGLTQRQVIEPHESLLLPINLRVPSSVDGTLRCKPTGGAVVHGRETLVFTCTLDQQVHNDRLDARVQLAGVEEVDVLTGVRLSSSFSGYLSGYERSNTRSRMRRVDDHLRYERTTEFE